MSSFKKKTIRLTIVKDPLNGNFKSSNKNTLTIEGLRILATVEAFGGCVSPQANIKIFGLSEAVINELTDFKVNTDGVKKNTIRIEAGDVGSVLSEVFVGDMMKVYGDYGGMPDVSLVVQAQTNMYHQLNPVPPLSVNGTADVAVLMKSLADKMGLVFEDLGVKVQLAYPYFANTLIVQAIEIAKAADIALFFDKNIMVIAPKGTPRKCQVPLINAKTGLIGYPTICDTNRIKFKCLYNPAIQFLGSVKLETAVDIANGLWLAVGFSQQLESEQSNGAWFTEVSCVRSFNDVVTK
jgi:hypothetical protein